MSNTVAAPAGAILTVLAIAARVPVPLDEAVDQWLAANELVGPNEGGIPDLTDRGRAWVAMIEATPIPVPVAKWGDPRINYEWVEKPAAPPAKGAARPAGAIAPSAPAAGATAIPPGFIVNQWVELPPGQLPPIPGLARDTELEVIFENGKTDKRGQYLKLYAGQVIFKSMGKGDDVIAFKPIAAETLLVAGG